MHCVEEIKNGIYWVGCNDFRTELFERIFPFLRVLLIIPISSMMKRRASSMPWINRAVTNFLKM